jgi:hypothetical protein
MNLEYREYLAIVGALKENKGLIDLDLRHHFITRDKTWDALCDSLKTHPTLCVLNLKCWLGEALLAPAVLNSRIHALVEMMTVNMSIHTIHLNSYYSEHELYRSQSFLISRRICSGREFVPSKGLAQLRTVPRCSDRPFLVRVPIPIAFGCCYQGIPKLPFRRRLRRQYRLPASAGASVGVSANAAIDHISFLYKLGIAGCLLQGSGLSLWRLQGPPAVYEEGVKTRLTHRLNNRRDVMLVFLEVSKPRIDALPVS